MCCPTPCVGRGRALVAECDACPVCCRPGYTLPLMGGAYTMLALVVVLMSLGELCMALIPMLR